MRRRVCSVGRIEAYGVGCKGYNPVKRRPLRPAPRCEGVRTKVWGFKTCLCGAAAGTPCGEACPGLVSLGIQV